uniref:Vpu protein n=1 Tax=Human immunodeficiency virus type 1 TaxID=11676 RepID=P89647_HV1|nr:vpu protein [Human immunodeficiency virus 1]
MQFLEIASIVGLIVAVLAAIVVWI